MTSKPGVSTEFLVPRPKAEGAFLALAAGDALGWPQEFRGRGRPNHSIKATTQFRDWERQSGGRFYAHREVIRAGECSDDTQLTLAVARSRISSVDDWARHLSLHELPLWTLYERGGGGATKRAATSWLKGVPPWQQTDKAALRRYFDAGGNGVAMRILAHSLQCARSEEQGVLLKDVFADGVMTHGHPRALVGAAALAYVTWWLFRSTRTLEYGELTSLLLDTSAIWGEVPEGIDESWARAASSVMGDFRRSWVSVVEEMVALLRTVQQTVESGAIADDEELLRKIGAYGSTKGAGTVGAAAAVYLASRYAAHPIQAVLRAAFAAGTDTDTIAAMTGGLVGALAGSDWIPQEWYRVQDAAYLREVANRLAVPATSREVRAVDPVGSKDVDKIVTSLIAGEREDLDLGGVRTARVVDFLFLRPLSQSTTVQGWQLESSDGQVLFITKVGRRPKGERRSAPLPDATTHRFGGEWTQTKLAVLGKYLASYTLALRDKPSEDRPFRKGYIDAFAGTGSRDAREERPGATTQEWLFPELVKEESQALLDGSARIALRTEPRFDRYVFIEKSAARCTELERLREEFPDVARDIQIRHGDANAEIQALCAKDWSSHRAVLFLDPYGMQVEWKTIEAIAATKAIDLWLLFPLGIGVNRLLTKSGDIPDSWRERLDLLLGTTDWYDEFYKVETTPTLFGTEQERVVKATMETIGRYFNNRLKEVFPGVVEQPGVLRNSANNPLYLLCFAVGNERGKNIALRIAEHLLKEVR